MKFEKLENIDSRAYVDGQPLLYGFMEVDPVFEYLQKRAKESDKIEISSDFIGQVLKELKQK